MMSTIEPTLAQDAELVNIHWHTEVRDLDHTVLSHTTLLMILPQDPRLTQWGEDASTAYLLPGTWSALSLAYCCKLLRTVTACMQAYYDCAADDSISSMSHSVKLYDSV